mmetsp:Transcript_89320/g.255812  ORF Transcript_89320/g.255812 Transcript_89320/m.255812 type:complete len:326 (-) Transcript_89320:64-1041(-)
MTEMALVEVRGPCSMGVTALLDELLAENCGRETPPSSPVYEPRERVEEGLGRPGGPEVSPRSRDIAELCGEMDSCLASLGQWEEESRLRVLALRKDLEAQYGFAFDENAARFPAWEAQDCIASDPEDENLNGSYRRLLEKEELVIEAHRRAIAAQARDLEERPGSAGSLMATSPLKASTPRISRILHDPQRQNDEDRISKLKAEVDILRQREAEMQQEIMQQWLEIEGAEGSPERSSDLSALCCEADCLLRDGSPAPAMTTLEVMAAIDAEEQEEFARMEARLASAQAGLGAMEAALDSARSEMDSELSELERLLSVEDRSLGEG